MRIRAVVRFGGTQLEVRFDRRSLLIKRALDLAVSIPALVVLSPLLLLLALAVKLDSPGTVLFRQVRLGQAGRPFQMYKLRSMVTDAVTMGDGLSSYEGDARVTRVGRFLRTWALDELPQLWNIVKGEMSLVGPRPPVVDELGDLSELPSHALYRFCVKPGVTGLAQIEGRNDLSWPEKIEYDTAYVQRLVREGIRLDLRILIATVSVLLRRRGLYDIRGKSQKLS